MTDFRLEKQANLDLLQVGRIMSNVSVSVRFRPLNPSEEKLHGKVSCVEPLDKESFLFKDEKEDVTFCFDRVFYQDSQQAEVYDFLLRPILEDAVKGINGTIITYGQTGAGKTFSMEGHGILDSDDHNKGLLARFIDGLFDCMRTSQDVCKTTVKLSMVEIYMEKVRDLLDLSKDNLQIKESKSQGIYLYEATEICVENASEALNFLSNGLLNKALGETKMNAASSRSHCLYIVIVQQEFMADARTKTGKVMLVDLAGSEKVEKTGATGRLLEEAKSINKSLSALGNVINSLTNGKMNHVPYRDSKLTRILQDALGGNSRAALLCCCSPSNSNSSETLSTLRFGTRAKLIRVFADVRMPESAHYRILNNVISRIKRLMLREKISEDHAHMLDTLLSMESLNLDPYAIEDTSTSSDLVATLLISALLNALAQSRNKTEELKKEKNVLQCELDHLRHVVAVEMKLAEIRNQAPDFKLGQVARTCLILGFVFSMLFHTIVFSLTW